jgi:hypothetical protein
MSSPNSVADVLGPWIEPDWDSSLIERCKNAWNKPFEDLTNHEVATLLLQRFATEYLLPIASKRVQEEFDDDSEIYDGELKDSIKSAQQTS